MSFGDYVADSEDIFEFLGGLSEWYVGNKTHEAYK